MTIFTGQTPAATYGNIITIGGSQNSGLTNVLTPLQDAYGHNTILRVSTIAFNIDRSSGDFQLDGVDVTSQAVDINSMSAPNPVALGVASLTLPVGGTAERPGVPVNGMLRYNTDFGYIESYESGTWTTAGGTITVTGTANQINATAGPNVILTISDDPIIPGTGGLQVPAGTTAQRAGAAGSIRFNTTSNLTEITNDGATWFAVSTTAGVVNSVSGTLNQITVVGAADPVVSLSSTLLFPGTVAIDNGNDLAFFDSTGVGFASFAPPVGDFVGNATYSLPDNVPAVSGYVLSATTAGVMSWVPNTAGSMVSVVGTANEIVVDSTDPQNPIVGIADNPIIPGTAAITIPVGTTAQQPAGAAGDFRYNSDSHIVEYYNAFTTSWDGLAIEAAIPSYPLSPTLGGTGLVTYTLGDIIYSSAADTLAALAGNTTTTQMFLAQTGDGANSAAPSWVTIPAGTVTSVSGTANEIVSSGGATPVLSLSTTILLPGTIAIDNGNDLTFFDSTGIGFASFAPPVGDFVGNATYSLPDNVPAVSGYVLSSTTAGVMSWVANSAGSVISVSGTADRITIGGTAQDPIIDIASTYVGQTSITTLGTVATGTWNASVVAGQYGGTGVANTGKTITLGGNLTTSGAFNSTFTMTAATSVTFPTTGTLATTSNVVPYDIAFSAGYTSAGVAADAAVQSYGFLVMGRAGTFTGEVGYADTAPTDAALIIDVFKNGVTIYSTKPQFAATSQTLTAGTLSVTTFAAGDRVTFKITQIGSTLAGQGIRFSVKATTGII